MTTNRKSPSRGEGSPSVVGFYEPNTGSIQYLAIDEATKACAIIDAVVDFDPTNACTDVAPARAILDYIAAEGLELEYILDTHPHADHFMASGWLKDQTGAKTGIGEKVEEVAGLWRDYYHLPNAFTPRGAFDHLFADGETFKLGSLDVRVMLSPGHTLASVTYIVGTDAAFVHDTFMQPDSGTARADFPGGSAHVLYQSLQSILALPEDTRLFVGHDYPGEDRDEPEWEATVAEQKAHNIHVGGGVGEASYVETREARDKTLSLPDRMLFALQVNLRGGRLPPAEDDGRHYLKIPVNRFCAQASG